MCSHSLLGKLNLATSSPCTWQWLMAHCGWWCVRFQNVLPTHSGRPQRRPDVSLVWDTTLFFYIQCGICCFHMDDNQTTSAGFYLHRCKNDLKGLAQLQNWQFDPFILKKLSIFSYFKFIFVFYSCYVECLFCYVALIYSRNTFTVL